MFEGLPRDHNDDTRFGTFSFIVGPWGLLYEACLALFIVSLFNDEPAPAGIVGSMLPEESTMETCATFFNQSLLIGGIVGILIGLMTSWMNRVIERLLGSDRPKP
jgi:hypothetical protein